MKALKKIWIYVLINLICVVSSCTDGLKEKVYSFYNSR